MSHKIFVDGFALRFPRAGVVNYIYNIIRLLNENPECDVNIILHDLGFSDPALKEFAESIPHRLVGETDFERRQRSLLGNIWQLPDLLLPLPGVTTRHTDPCDVYHCTDIYYYPSTKAHKNVIMVHDLTTTLYPESHEPLNIEKERQKLIALDNFDSIVVNSNATKVDVIKHCGIDESKISTLYLGTDLIYDSPQFIERRELTDSLGIPTDRRYLLSVSTIEPRKNIIGVLEAFRLFAERNRADDDVVLVLAGRHGWNNERLNDYFKTYPLRDRVFFTGFIPNELMPSLYHFAEAFIYLSFYEGFGLPILEAMKSGTPVICSNTSSMPEVIGSCGTTVSPRSPEEGCAAIEHLMSNTDLAEQNRKNGLARSKSFTWNTHVEQLLSVFGIRTTPSPRNAVTQLKWGTLKVSSPVVESTKVNPQDVRYKAFLQKEQRIDAIQRKERLEHIEIMTVRPHFYILIEGDDRADINASRQSCADQIYPPSRVECAYSDLLTNVQAPAYLVILRAGDILHERALYECAVRINIDPTVTMIYFDEDCISAEAGRHKPFFKPDWSPDFLEAVNYVGSAACYALAFASNVIKDAEGLYDFTLRFTEMANNIAHLRQVLLHRSVPLDAPQSDATLKTEMKALKKRLNRTGRQGHVEQVRRNKAAYRVNPILGHHPLVSIVIPTAAKTVEVDGQKRDLISTCLKSIVEKSTYRNLEFVIVENGDLSRNRLRHAESFPIRYVTYLDQQVNISRKMNMGAANAAGEYLLLLNDDTEVITPDWIERLLYHFEKPHVGLVGGKLLYPDRTIQHAGVIVAHGHPDHVSRGEQQYSEGYYFSGCAVRNYQAMTGAMTLIPANLYRELGGYEERMPLTFNDIDLSMKVWQSHYSVVYDPDVELFHFEGKSATDSYNFDDRDLFYQRWGRSPLDRFYNEYYLSLSPANYGFNENNRFI